jgi:hypothetical protein
MMSNPWKERHIKSGRQSEVLPSHRNIDICA